MTEAEMRWLKDVLRSMRMECQKAKRNCNNLADELENLDGVPDESVGYYRGMAKAYAQQRDYLDKMRKEL